MHLCCPWVGWVDFLFFSKDVCASGYVGGRLAGTTLFGQLLGPTSASKPGPEPSQKWDHTWNPSKDQGIFQDAPTLTLRWASYKRKVCGLLVCFVFCLVYFFSLAVSILHFVRLFQQSVQTKLAFLELPNRSRLSWWPHGELTLHILPSTLLYTSSSWWTLPSNE